MRTELLIDGRFVEGSGEYFDILDPATEKVYAAIRSAEPEQVDEAVAAAAAAFEGWRSASQEDRSAALRAVAGAIRDRADEIADVVTHETGRARTRNVFYVEYTARVFEQYAELARVHGGRVAPSNEAGQLSLVLRVPYGVVAALVPWNYPLTLLAFKAAPALATGNAVVIKPAPETTATTLLLGEILDKHLPAGVVNVVAGGGGVGACLVEHPGVHLVAFTGSTETGKDIGSVCGRLAKPVRLELSGKDPAVVFPDVDVEAAAHGVAWAAFLNAGQVCTSTERAYVHADVYDRFVERVTTLAAALRVGNPFDAQTQVGPMQSEQGRQRVLDQLGAAIADGAKILYGGDPLAEPGYYLRPTVLTNVDHSMDVMREETFGPVLPIMPFTDDDEAFRLAGDTYYGLGASFYTRDPSRVRRAYEEMAVGTVWINDPVVDNLGAPFGGMRGSGDARELGVEALASFTSPRHVHWNIDLEIKPWWYREEE